jgi:hypothetical protein
VRFAWQDGFGQFASPRLASRVAPPTRRRSGAVSATARVAMVGGAAVGTWRVQEGSRVQVEPIGRPDDDRAYGLDAEATRLETLVGRELKWAASLRWL